MKTSCLFHSQDQVAHFVRSSAIPATYNKRMINGCKMALLSDTVELKAMRLSAMHISHICSMPLTQKSHYVFNYHNFGHWNDMGPVQN